MKSVMSRFGMNFYAGETRRIRDGREMPLDLFQRRLSRRRKMEYETLGLLHEQFVSQAKKTPDAIAVVSPEENKSATFAQLDQWTDSLAAALRTRGVGPDVSVGIYLHKTVDFVTAYVAILRAGGGYLLIDTSYPAHLLEAVILDSKPAVIITCPDLLPKLQACPEEQVLCLASGWQEQFQKDHQKNKNGSEPSSLTMDSLAYTVYSSGTTGKPKGIMCPHRGAVFSYHYKHTHYPYSPDDREACNIFFVWEMLRPMMKGVPLYIVPNNIVYDPPYLCGFLRDHLITRMLFTPSLLETVLNRTPLEQLKQDFKSMRQIWFCGEVVTTTLLARCIEALPWVRFLNLYSVSECHDVACGDLSQYYADNKDVLLSRKFCPVGQVIKGVDIIIMDDEGKVQPVGLSGEIYVGGPTLARGYINRPEIQKTRFVTINGNSKRLYRTGDCGYMMSDRSLEICGRIDSMVKVRGYSIEVQAVESCLLSLYQVNACTVLVKGEEGEDKFLVAYIVLQGHTNKKEIRAELKKRLPFYMIPSYFLFIQSIPVLPSSGKLDKNALPAFDSQNDDIGAEGRPSTVTEIALAEIWIAVLNLKEVDIQESFFDLGGHSLIASEILQRARIKFNVQLAVRDLFSYPTIAGLAKLIDSKIDSQKALTPDKPDDLDLMAEVRRNDLGVVNLDMQLRAFWRSFQLGSRFARGRVLLTGATGFLGSFLLKDLLLNTKLVVYCLVRELPQKTPEARVHEALEKFGILTLDETNKSSEEQIRLKYVLEHRVNVLKGNVSLLRLGLSEEDYTYLCTDIDFIIHSAATVNLAYPYSALHGTNVVGTANIIQFASSGKVKALHFISTDGVFPHGLTNCKEDDDISVYSNRLQDGYAQSKWVAEQLVSKSRDRGMPVTIFRLGNMSGDSKRGYWNPQDFTLLILQICTLTGLYPDVTWDMEMTPVDFAAKVIVMLTQRPDCAIGRTLHIINDKPIKAKEVFQWMKVNKFPVRYLPFDDWKTSVLQELPKSCKVSGLSADRVERILDSYVSSSDFLSNLSTYNNDGFQQVLTELGLAFPYTGSKMLKTYFSELTRRHVLSRRKSILSLSQPLSDCVAVVTGASSGIGSATAKALAAAGAKVAVAARRLPVLDELVEAINEKGGEAISVQTDVTDREQVKRLIRVTESSLGPVSILVNCAGLMYYTLMKNFHEDEWERQIDVNCKGVVNGIGAALGGMITRGQGHIVNISSDAGRTPFPGLAVYTGTKFFVEGMSRALRQEVAGTGVKVTCIQPGDVKTPLLSISTDKEALEQYGGSESVQVLEPQDVAKAIVYAVTQPSYVAVNEILVEPREAPA